MANTEVLEPSQQLRWTVEHLLHVQPTHENKRTVARGPDLRPQDDRVQPNGIVNEVSTVPIEFVAMATRDEAGQQLICWTYEGPLWVDDTEAEDAADPRVGGVGPWLRLRLGARCFRVDPTGQRANSAVPVRAYFKIPSA